MTLLKMHSMNKIDANVSKIAEVGDNQIQLLGGLHKTRRRGLTAGGFG